VTLIEIIWVIAMLVSEKITRPSARTEGLGGVGDLSSLVGDDVVQEVVATPNPKHALTNAMAHRPSSRPCILEGDGICGGSTKFVTLRLRCEAGAGWLKKMSLGYTNGAGSGVCTKSGICPSAWQIDTLAPLGDSCIYEACKHVTSSRRMQCHEWVKRLIGRGWTRYRDIGDLTLDKI
jgi:hypothetical protein